MLIKYLHSNKAWSNYDDFVKFLSIRTNARSICEVGAGANPSLSLDFLKINLMKCTLLDISANELSKAPDDYDKYEVDICEESLTISEAYNFMFSKMLAEHVPSGYMLHKNVFNLLAPNGIAIHFFPTLFTMPFVFNRIMPDRITNQLLEYFAPRDTYQYAKFPAYYKWCKGPTHYQIRRLQNIGYTVIAYIGFYGHADYWKRVKIVQNLHEIKTAYLLNHPIPYFTSYAWVVLGKNSSSAWQIEADIESYLSGIISGQTVDR